MTKVVAGVAEVAAGAAITVKTGGLAAAGGVAMAVDGASRAQGGVADFANLFRSPESQLGNWDTVEVGFQQALGPELGTAVRESTSAVLTFGTSALVAGGGSPAAAKAPAKPATTAEAPETTADAIRKGAEAPKSATEPRGGTYKLRDPETGQVRRTGRSKDLARREKEHFRDPATRDLEFEADKRTDVYKQQRGREHQIYEQHPEADLNKVRPISPRNPRRKSYLDAAEELD